MPKRSPVIFWLLLAATICVDLAAIVWIDHQPDRIRSASIYFGLVFGQLSALTVWAILRPTKVGVRWFTPFIAATAFATIWPTMLQGPHPDGAVYVFLGLLSLHVVGAMLAVWLIRPTRLLIRWTNADPSRCWQFGIGHLLALMTGLAVLLVILGRAVPLLDEARNTSTLLIANIVLLLAALASVEKFRFVLFSLAASLGAAIAIAAVCDFLKIAFASELSLFLLGLIQAFVLWCWCVALIPPRDSSSVVAESQATTTPL
jgi:hypothetical protein